MALEIQDYQLSLQRSRLALTRADRPSRFVMNSREWDLLPEVFAPIYSPSTKIAMDLLGLTGSGSPPRADSMLEIGCGTGIIAVSTALAGVNRVVAVDINPSAVDNAAMNAARHGVADRFRAVHSDLFTGLDERERFDLIFWSSPYVCAPADYEFQSMHERGYVDPGYAGHRRFLAEAPSRLTSKGSALLHFSTRGDLTTLLRIAGEYGCSLRMRASTTCQEGEHEVEHMLIEVLRLGGRRAHTADRQL